MGNLLSVAEVAAMTGLSRATVLRRLRSGALRGEQVGGTWVVYPDSVAELSNPPAGRAENDPYSPAEVAKLAGCSTQLVHHHLNAGTLRGERTPAGKWVVPAEEARRFAAEPRAIGRPRKKGPAAE